MTYRDEPDRDAAHQRARLYSDLRDIVRYGLDDVEAAYVADRLWARGWRQAGSNRASQDEHSGPTPEG